MSDPALSSAPPQARLDKQRLPEIALVGSRSNFSDNLVAATGRHLRDLMLIHLPSLEAFNALPPDRTRWLRLLVIDDITLRNSPETALGGLCCPPATSIVLAFIDLDHAASVYCASSKALPIESYIPLDVRLDVWLSILKLLLHGGKYVPEELLAHHRNGHRPDHQRPHAPAEPLLGLTPRQYNVLKLVAAGLPNKSIATRLGLSDHTIKLHIHNIITKLGVTNRTEAAARFYDDAP